MNKLTLKLGYLYFDGIGATCITLARGDIVSDPIWAYKSPEFLENNRTSQYVMVPYTQGYDSGNLHWQYKTIRIPL